MSGTDTDLANLGDRPIRMITVSIAFLTLAWTTVTLRACVRGFIIRSFGWDDWTMLLCLVCVYRYMLRQPVLTRC